jgi:lysozyme
MTGPPPQSPTTPPPEAPHAPATATVAHALMTGTGGPSPAAPPDAAGAPPRDLGPAVQLIKRFEGLEDGDPTTANLDPYICPAGYWTIGWGHVVLDHNGQMLHGPENQAAARAVYPDGMTLATAETLLQDDVRRFSGGVGALVTATINDNQFCALVSFAYNVGLGALQSSTLLQRLNGGRPEDVPAQLLRWNKSGGQVLPGLTRRRQAEADLWSTASGPVDHPDIA